MPMLEQNNRTEQRDPLLHAAFEQQQRRRMLIALMVLLLALVSVLIKDHQFWFPSSPNAESETPDESVPRASPPAGAIKTASSIAPLKPAGPAPAHERPKSKRSTPAARSTTTPDATPPFIVATNRAVLPPLQVEVVAGNQHRAITPGDGSVKLDMQPSDQAASEQPAAFSPDSRQRSCGDEDSGASSAFARQRASYFSSRSQLSLAREADEGARCGRAGGSDQQERQHSGHTGVERSGNSFRSCPRGGQAVALQALLPGRATGRNRGTRHREFHHLDLLI